MKLRHLLPVFLVFVLFSCEDVQPFEIDNVNFGDPEIGIPLVNTQFLVSDLGDNPNDNTTIEADADGRLTVKYNGEVLRQDADFVFPPLPFADYIEVQDTVFEMFLPLEDFVIRKAVFRGTAVKFLFENDRPVPLDVTMSIAEFTKNGEVFSNDFVVEANSTFESEFFSLDGYTVETTTSTFFFNYDARTPDGERIKMKRAAMFVDFLHFSYGEGFFGYKEYNLSEDVIDIGVFNNWISGGLSFDRPSVTFEVENNFGFPVRAAFKKMQLTTINGDIFELEGPAIDEGINFAYPDINEVGELKNTSISFDNSNSNLGDLFNEKAASVSYDVDAIANPDNDPNVVGHFTDSSYFTVNVSVDLPLSFKANDLIMADTFDFQSLEYDQLDSLAELHLKVVNAFPVSLSLNMDFLDEDGQHLFTLQEDEEWITADASEDPTKTLEELDDQVHIIPLTSENVALFSKVKDVAIYAKVTTLDTFGEDFVWVYKHHGVAVSLGAILN